jgi:hypothetical protein
MNLAIGGELGLGAVFGRDLRLRLAGAELRLRLVVGEDTRGELWSRIEVGGVRDLGTRRGAEQQENNGENVANNGGSSLYEDNS